MRPTSSIHFHQIVPLCTCRVVGPAYPFIVRSYCCRGPKKSPRCCKIHLETLLSIPIVLESASSCMLLFLSAMFGNPAALDANSEAWIGSAHVIIAVVGAIVTIDPTISRLPLDLAPLHSRFLLGWRLVLGRLLNAMSMSTVWAQSNQWCTRPSNLSMIPLM